MILTQYTPGSDPDDRRHVQRGSTDIRDFQEFYRREQMDVPVFSIMFGDAQESQLEELAEFTNARVFDGREDLIGAFRV